MAGYKPVAFWSGDTLFVNGSQLVDPFDPQQIDCNAYVLRMGEQYYRTADQEQVASGIQKRTNLSANESFVIPPGQFAFLLSKETITVPKNAMAFISMRTQIKFQGLINVSGFHVDPGYVGKLVYAVYNASPSPVHLSENDLVFKIWFCDLNQTSDDLYVKKPREGIREIRNDMVRGMNREILSLQSLAEKIRDQEKKMHQLLSSVEQKFAEQKPTIDNLTFVWRAAIIIVLGSIIVSIVHPAISTLWRAVFGAVEFVSPIPSSQPTQTTTPQSPPQATVPGESRTRPDGKGP